MTEHRSRIIFLDVPPADMDCAVRAAKWIIDRPQYKNAINCYGKGDDERCFYMQRNKASITIRPC
jgi:hypothetical protein